VQRMRHQLYEVEDYIRNLEEELGQHKHKLDEFGNCNWCELHA